MVKRSSVKPCQKVLNTERRRKSPLPEVGTNAEGWLVSEKQNRLNV